MREYLAPHHRDHPSTGCPSAALLDEIGRCDVAVRDSYTEGVQAIVTSLRRTCIRATRRPLAPTALGLFTVLVATCNSRAPCPIESCPTTCSNRAFAMH